MDFASKDLINAIGPSAALVFASWIYMGFLQQRYTSAFERYRALIDNYRGADVSQPRRDSLKKQILAYKKRCEIMKSATNTGLIAAIFMMVTLITVVINVLVSEVVLFKYIVAICSVIGFCLIIFAAIQVIRENIMLQGILESEVSDIAELAREANY